MERYALKIKSTGEDIGSFAEIKLAFAFMKKRIRSNTEYYLFDNKLNRLTCYIKK